MARRAPPERWREFLSPLDVPAMLAKGQEPGANSFMVAGEIARSLRAHLRLLSRAIAAWEDVPPAELLTALIATVRTGAMAHEEKGRVAAFSAHLESGTLGGYDDRPIAVDLGEALQALQDDRREQLLLALLGTDEPLLLAQLVTVAPHSTRVRIRDRIGALTPDEAGRVSSLNELQARIEALLSAGAVDAAARFIEVEKGLQTWGKVPGRELARLRMEMMLRHMRGDFEAVATAVAPAELAPSERAEAEEILEFYKALAELSKPGGSLDAAEAVFQRLHARRPDVAAYAVNLLAVRVNRMLSGDLFGRLRGAEAARAREALADADAAMSRLRGVCDGDLAIHACNRALLLLATGLPERALEALTGARSSHGDDRLAAYSAVALARMDRGAEATGALERAKTLLGDTETLRAARTQIQRGAPLVSRAGVISVDDRRGRVKAALGDLRQMDSSRQAEVFFDPPEGLDEMTISHVRAAAASVVALVPQMKQVVLDKCEDDVTAVLKAVLEARLEYVGWAVPDQSRGGFTEKGNPGERDLLLRKDGAVLAVLEAVVCNRPATHEWTKKELASHFQKLLGYSTCRIFFHLTYSYVSDPGAVLDELRRAAENEAPNGFVHLRREEISRTDSRPTGFASTYQYSLGEVKVVFLVLDMAQHAQRNAAKTAATNNPRRKKEQTS
jgi:hypothetical protein